MNNPEYVACGNSVVIGDNSLLLCWDEYKGIHYSPEIYIGDNFNATRHLTIQCVNKVHIGKDVLCASDVFIIDYNYGTNPLTGNYLDNPLFSRGGVYIDDGAWIGNNVIILQDVHIGKKVIIGAGSVVTKNIPDYSIVVGNPAKVIKRYNHDSGVWEQI